ncbi:MAG TPA: C45 family peptidase [Actinomycetota bacterium]|nr:C45 family peptidase [Actinomycetota bacterium]
MAEHPIPLLRAAGTYREVGAAIGEASAGTLVRECDTASWAIPSDRTVDEQLALADRYAEPTRAAMPWIFEELEGSAEAAGVDPLALWACCIEEIWYEPRAAGRPGAAIAGRCSDLVAVPPATADGHVLTAHNNDMSRRYQHDLIAIERTCNDDPSVLTIGNGIWISTGWNDAGLNLTGNELSPNDERIGIPREIQVRAMLREPTLQGMLEVALHPDRASSYNNVLVDASGAVANVEGSATAAFVTGADDEGHLVHTNHYVCDAMLPYEGDPEYAVLSARRYARAADLLAAAPAGTVTVELLHTFLQDHEGAPDSLCRHEAPGRTSVTAFWCVADLTDGMVRFGRGNPCDSEVQEHRFAGAAA